MTEPVFDLQPHAEGLAALVVDQLNVLYSEGCCADCCAPCAFIRKIAEDDTLEKIIAFAPAHLTGGNVAYMDPDQTVNRAWLNSRWGCMSHPPCDARDLEDPIPSCADESAGDHS